MKHTQIDHFSATQWKKHICKYLRYLRVAPAYAYVCVCACASQPVIFIATLFISLILWFWEIYKAYYFLYFRNPKKKNYIFALNYGYAYGKSENNNQHTKMLKKCTSIVKCYYWTRWAANVIRLEMSFRRDHYRIFRIPHRNPAPLPVILYTIHILHRSRGKRLPNISIDFALYIRMDFRFAGDLPCWFVSTYSNGARFSLCEIFSHPIEWLIRT